jgi:hypothetical protein
MAGKWYPEKRGARTGVLISWVKGNAGVRSLAENPPEVRQFTPREAVRTGMPAAFGGADAVPAPAPAGHRSPVPPNQDRGASGRSW